MRKAKLNPSKARRASVKARWPQADLLTLDAEIVAILDADNPQSVRHVFYRLTDPSLPVSVEKSDSGYNRVQRRLKALRESGIVPYGHVVDMTRAGWFTPTYADPGEYLREVAGLYRRDIWERLGVRVEVWAESRSIAGVLYGLCRELAVPLYPLAGFGSDTLIHDAAEDIAAWGADLTAIYYIGDFDPAGVLIDVDAEGRLRDHLDRVGGDPDGVTFERLAITQAQIADLGLPTKPRKEGDKRALDVTETVEAEAMAADYLRALVRQAIEEHLPDGEIDAIRAAEASEREGLYRLAESLPGSFNGLAQ